MSCYQKSDFSYLDVLIPVRIDSAERKQNLTMLLKHLFGAGLKNIILLETGDTPRLSIPVESGVRYYFAKDTSREFRKNMHTNSMYSRCGKYVAVFDADIIVPKRQLIEAYNLLMDDAVLVFPYDGRCFFMDREKSRQFRKSIDLSFAMNNSRCFLGRPSVGGVYFVNKEKFIYYGGENEAFVGWGPEDAERIKRLEILGATVKRVDGPIYYAYHPATSSAQATSERVYRKNQREFLRVCGLSKPELQKEVLDNPNHQYYHE